MPTPTTALAEKLRELHNYVAKSISSIYSDVIFRLLGEITFLTEEEVGRLTREAKGWHEQYDVATRNRNELLAVADEKVAKLTNERDLARENLRKHGERLVLLTRNLAEEQLNRRTLRDELVNTIAERDNANLVSETAGKELKRFVEQGYAREAVLKNERDSAQAFARYNTNATNRVRQEVADFCNHLRSTPRIREGHACVDEFEKAVEAAAQPLADEVVGDAGVTPSYAWRDPEWLEGEHQAIGADGRLIATVRRHDHRERPLYEASLARERPHAYLGEYESLDCAKSAVSRALIAAVKE